MQNQMNNQYMNMNIMQNQMLNNMNNNFNQNINMNINPQIENNKEKEEDIFKKEPEDIYPYIKDPKKEIIFVTSDFKRKRVLIPESLRKNELYYTSERFRCHKYSEIKLLHNTEILDNDDTSIECISNQDIIKINESLDVDTSFYESLLLKYKNFDGINISLYKSDGITIGRYFPSDLTVLDMMKVFLSIMKIPFKYLYSDGSFLYNGENLIIKKNEFLKNLFKKSATITYSDSNQVIGGDPFINLKIGKILNLNLNSDNNNRRFTIGTLAQIKEFYKGLEMFNEWNQIVKRIDKVILYPGNIEIDKNDERTFSAIGIRNDFECKVILAK